MMSSIKYSLDFIMEQIKFCKNIQKRYAEQYLSKSNDAAVAGNSVADITD